MHIDTHAHLNFKAFQDDVEDVIKECLENNINMINVGSCISTSKRAVELARPGVWAAVGLHPVHADKDEKITKDLVNENVVAIGEVGLDYLHKPKTTARKIAFKEKQEKCFRDQIELAISLDLPLILHCRYAHNEMIKVLSDYNVRGVVHCYTGDMEQTKQYLDMGLYLGFNGLIFKDNMEDIIKYMPADRILAETDCPFLHPDKERNTPLFVRQVEEKIKGMRSDVDFTANACRLFGIKV
jgi:TatD DNase family protein